MAFVSPRQRFRGYRVPSRDPSIPAVCRERRACTFRPMHPTAFVRRIVQRNSLCDLQRFCRRHHVRPRTRGMGVDSVLDQPTLLRRPIVPSDQLLEKLRILDGGASCADLHRAKAGMGFERQQHTPGPMRFTCMISTLGLTRLQGEGHQESTQPWTRSRILPAHGRAGSVRSRIVVQASFHMPDRVAGQLATAPALVHPELACVFFHAFRTLAPQMASTTWRATRRSAIRGRVQGHTHEAKKVTVCMVKKQRSLRAVVRGVA